MATNTTPLPGIRLTTMAHGGGCASKIPAGELEEVVTALAGQHHDSVVVGLDDGDDAAAVRIADGLAVLSTADFFTPVRSEEHTSELQSRGHLVCRLLLEKKKKTPSEHK